MDRIDRYARGVAYAIVALLVGPILYHLIRGTGGHLALVTDDFYYYALTARSLAATGRSTFDGLTLTNGYRPLFMGLLMLLARVTGGLGTGFFVGLAAVFAFAGCLCFELYLRLGRRLFPASRLPAVLAAAAMLETARMVVWGMETTLALPLQLFVLERCAAWERITNRRAAGMGLACSLLVLARLDEALLVGMIVLGALLFSRASLADQLKRVAAFGASAALVPAYLVLNRIVFGGWLPVSGEAKQLLLPGTWNQHLLRDLWSGEYGRAAILLIPLSLVVLVFDRRSRPAPAARFAAALALIFPVIFYVIWALRSDWWLFQWYQYPLPAAVFVGALIVMESVVVRLPQSARRIVPTAAGSVLWVIALAGAAKVGYNRSLGWTREDNSIYNVALQLRDKLRDRPGVYAMGDRAGVTAFLLEQPVIQLEGLIADRRMVERIRNQAPLEGVLHEYGVDYLIVTLSSPLERDGDCYRVYEPNRQQAGTHSCKMTARLCQQPISQFETVLKDRGMVAGTCYTYVFDVRSSAHPLPASGRAQ